MDRRLGRRSDRSAGLVCCGGRSSCCTHLTPRDTGRRHGKDPFVAAVTGVSVERKILASSGSQVAGRKKQPAICVVSGSRLAPCDPPRSSSPAAPVYDDGRRGLPPRSTPVHHTHAAAARAGGRQMDASTLLLPCSDGAVAGAVDFRGRPASRSGTGRWSAAMFVLGTVP